MGLGSPTKIDYRKTVGIYSYSRSSLQFGRALEVWVRSFGLEVWTHRNGFEPPQWAGGPVPGLLIFGKTTLVVHKKSRTSGQSTRSEVRGTLSGDHPYRLLAYWEGIARIPVRSGGATPLARTMEGCSAAASCCHSSGLKAG